jgi:hypothetical protein
MMKILIITLITSSYAVGEFKTIWRSDSAGRIIISLLSAKGYWRGNYSYSTDLNNCNDTYLDANGTVISLYVTPNTNYLVCFQSGFFGFYNPGDLLIGIKEWGNTSWVNTHNFFYAAFNLTEMSTVDTPNFSGDVRHMFSSATLFNKDISNWDTSMGSIFYKATSFNQNLGRWNMSAIGTNGFDGISIGLSGFSIDNYDNTLIGWSNQTLKQNGFSIGAFGLKYCNSLDARRILNSKGVTFYDDTYTCFSLRANVSFPSSSVFTLTNTGNESISKISNFSCNGTLPLPPQQTISCNYTEGNITIVGNESRNTVLLNISTPSNVLPPPSPPPVQNVSSFSVSSSSSVRSKYNISNTANVSGQSPDGNSMNTTTILHTEVSTISNLTLTKTLITQGEVNIGSIVQYQIVVSNTGETNIFNVTVTDNNPFFNQSQCIPPLPTNLSVGGNSTCNYSYTITI